MDPLQNLEQLVLPAREPVRAWAEKLQRILGDNLVALLAYGSATGPDFVPRRSDINLLVAVRVLHLPVLRSLLPIAGVARGRQPITPLFVTPDYVRRSADAFPIEFLEMKGNHVLLLGTDPLADLVIRRADVRRQCERDLRAHLLKLRQTYLQVGRSRREVERLLHRALSSLIPIFRHMLWLCDPSSPTGREEVLRALGPAFSVDPEPFLAVQRDRVGGGTISGKDAEMVLDQFLRGLEHLTHEIDRIQCDS